MQKFNVIKRERDYFLAQKGPYHCKIIIDEFSENLPLGEISLHVEEVTDKYKHFTREAVFKLTLPLDEQDSIGICTLSTGKKNKFVYKHCLSLGGKWERVLNQWVFSLSVSNKVEELGRLLHSEIFYIEATFKETLSLIGDDLTLFGYPLVKSVKPDGSVTFEKDIRLMEGDVAVMGCGKVKKTIVLAGSKLRLFVPNELLRTPSFHEDYICVVDLEKKRKPRKSNKFSWDIT
ncbi:hypothetical protein ACEO96_14920 [Vibrio anguillarum]|uniref:hypothetical protein n=1 Tax=Vibrio anguillarum TaxID=55601 RepID=UPI0035948CB7